MLVGLLVVAVNTYKGRPIPDMCWYTLMAMAGVNGAAYVTRRRQQTPRGSTQKPLPGVELAG